VSHKRAVADGDPQTLIQVTAREASAAAGAELRAHFARPLSIDEVFPHDLKLELDRTCEERVLSIISGRFPDHGVLSEERGYAPGVEPYLWVVDPLDGTVNFYHGIPFFCTSIACYRTSFPQGSPGEVGLPDGRVLGEPVVGVVYRPVAEELFVGVAGGGAFLNGRPLRLTPIASLSEAIVSLAFSARDTSIETMTRLLPRMVETARKVRSFGSTAVEIALVAAGVTGAFVQLGTNLWDFAAAAIVLREAGGVLEKVEITPGRWRIMASNRGIATEVSGLLLG
jgi:fructose-1,6-bisphosphatase/inositol monophosphatase family enzyme